MSIQPSARQRDVGVGARRPAEAQFVGVCLEFLISKKSTQFPEQAITRVAITKRDALAMEV